LLLVYKSGPVTLFSFAEKTMALMTPKMATSSQNMILRSKTKRLLQRERYEIRFFVRIRGALTPPPRMEVPVMKIPLEMSLTLE
jgi:hypothetical protein